MTTKSLSRQPEKAHEPGGFPLRAILLSLALHALVLGAFTPLPIVDAAGNAPAERLHAVLRSAPAVAVAPAVPPAPTFNKPPRRQLANPRNEPSAPAVAPTPAATGMPVPSVAGGEPAQRASAEPANVALAAPVATRGPDAAALRQYRLTLAGEARRFRRYPDMARREGIIGTAEVRVTVAADGLARHAELTRSSGHAVLDIAALDMLRQAAARALLPDVLRGQDFAVLLPVVFEVDE